MASYSAIRADCQRRGLAATLGRLGRAVGVEIPLQNQLSGDLVAALLPLHRRETSVEHGGIGILRREALVPVGDGQVRDAGEPVAKSAGLLCLAALVAAHVDRQSHDQSTYLFRFDELLEIGFVA